MSAAPPAWWPALQATLSAALTTPLQVRDGTLAPPETAAITTVREVLRAPRAARDPDAGLRLYREQYWMRLFVAAQTELPRLCAALGPWRFNQLVMLHVSERALSSPDLGRVADGLASAVLGRLVPNAPHDAWTTLLTHEVDREMVRHAARLDEALRRAFVAPWLGVWTPTNEELLRLTTARVAFAPSFSMGRLGWNFEVPAPGALVFPSPTRSDALHFWVVARTPDGRKVTEIGADEAAWLDLLRHHAFAEAAERLDARCDPSQRAVVQARIPQWIRRAVADGWWTGLA